MSVFCKLLGLRPDGPAVLLAVAGIAICFTASFGIAGTTPAWRGFLQKRCGECHDRDVSKGGLQVEQLAFPPKGLDEFNRLIRLYDRVQCGEMPPKKADQPTIDERTAFVNELREDLLSVEKQLLSNGRSSIRRMNRTEYEHALQDLLGLPTLRVKELLPEDGRQFGFDKVAGALDISHVQMAKYLEASQIALQQALVTSANAPQVIKWREPAVKQNTAAAAIATHNAAPLMGRVLAPGLSTHIVGNPVADPGNTYRAATFKGDADSLVIFSGVLGAHQPEGLQIDRFNPNVAGIYRVKFSTWSLRSERTKAMPAVRGVVRNAEVFGAPYFKDEAGKWKGTPLPKEKVRERKENVEFYGDAEATHIIRASLNGKPLGYFDAPSLKPKVHEITTWLNPGEKISFHAMSLPASGPANWGSADGVITYEGPGVAFDWFEVEGPIFEQWPPASQRRLFGEKPADNGNPRALLRDFADAAFRRPVDAKEMDPYLAIVNERLGAKANFQEAMLAGYKALLCSPDFLFLGLEGLGDDTAEPRSPMEPYALASRLSFLLWDSLPDETLRKLARSGELSQPAILRAQAERMLHDPRSDRFVEHFLDDWLEMRKIDFTTPDPNLYPEYDPWLHDSMVAETRAYFRKMLDENLGVSQLVASDFILVNQRLAELYGIKGILGTELRPVKLGPNSPRGGVLTQAAVLKVTANGTATSPVLRGVWVTERLMGIPRQPPPPNVPAVEPDATGAVTIRQMIEKHRADATCAACHAKMDPPGMALENFDVIGGWRDRYRIAGQPKKIRKGKELIEEPFVEIVADSARQTRVKLRLGSEVDSSGQLVDGRKFDDIKGLRKLLLADQDKLARNMIRQFSIYATGVGIRFADRDAIEAIITRERDKNFGMRSLLLAVIESDLFQAR